MNSEAFSVEQLKNAVERLPRDKLDQFRRWFEEFAADEWDRQIEKDAEAGKLDKLVAESEEEFRTGHFREL